MSSTPSLPTTPGPSAFTFMTGRAKSISTQVDEALAAASPNDETVSDLHKIVWKDRRFVLGSLLYRKTSRGRRSWIKDHGWFLIELGPQDVVRGPVWACSRCDASRKPQFFAVRSTTSSTDNLTKIHHLEPRQEDQEEPESVLELQVAASIKRPASEPIRKARITKIRQLAVGYIINTDLPFSSLTDPFIQAILGHLNGPVAAEVPWSKGTLVQDLKDIFDEKKSLIKQEIRAATSSIHFSFDLWTSPNHLAVIAIFAHFLNSKHQRCHRLIAFRQHAGRHSGKNIADTIEQVIRDWSFQEQAGMAICDNVSSNDTCLQALYPRFLGPQSENAVKARRMRCWGHILNLTAKAFLFGAEADSFELQSESFHLLGQQQEDLRHWRRKGPVGKLHNIVKFIRASPQRMEAFSKILDSQGEELDDPTHLEVFTLPDPASKDLKLIQNNATRWNSTHHMIRRAWKLHGQIQAYLTEVNIHPELHGNARLPEEDRLTPEDWRLLGELQEVLEPIHALTLQAEGNDGALWMVLMQMEWLMDHFETLKTRYDEVTPAVVQGSVTAGHNTPLDPAFMRDLDAQDTKAAQRHRERASRRRNRNAAAAVNRFNEHALPGYVREEYTASPAPAVNALGIDQQAYMRISLNNAWVKLNEYYTVIGESPLFAAAVILNPRYGFSWLQKKWSLPEQLQWLHQAREGLAAVLDRDYPGVGDEGSGPSLAQPRRLPPEQQEDDSPLFNEWADTEDSPFGHVMNELEQYLEIRPDKRIKDPIAWWVERKQAFPRLSRLALDLLAIPAMADHCERQFSLAKLSVSTQRCRLQARTLEFLQLLRSWIKQGGIVLGGISLPAP